MTRALTLAALLLALSPWPALATPALEACLRSGAASEQVAKACSDVLADPASTPTERFAALVRKGEAEVDLKQYVAAQADFRAALILNPRDPSTLVELGHVLHKSGAPVAQERELYDRALAIAPDHNVALLFRARLSSDAGLWEAALLDLERAHRARPSDSFIQRLRGEAYRALGRNAEALDDFRAALKRDPKDMRALEDYGFLSLELEDQKAVADASDRLLSLSADNSSGLILRAATLQAHDRRPEAIALLEALVKREPSNLRARTDLGELYIDTDRPELAEAQGSEALKLDPDNIDALMLRGHARAIRSDFKGALSDDDQAVSLSPTIKPIYQRGVHRGASGDHKGALEDYRKGAELEPDIAEIWRAMGHEARELDDAGTAVLAADRALKLAPDDMDAWALRAELYNDASDWAQAAPAYERAGEFLYAAEAWAASGAPAQALKAYDRAVKDDPKSTQAWLERGDLLVGQGRTREALKSYDQGLALAPADAHLLVSRANARAALKDLAGAQADLDAAAKAEPKAAFVFNARGLQAVDRDEPDVGVAEYDKAIGLDPKYADAYYNRAFALMGQNHYDRAIRDLNVALSLNPKDAQAMALKGEAFRRLGDHARALEVLDAAIALNPELAMALWSRSLAQAALGDPAAAKADRDRALKLDPTLARADS